MTEVAASFEKKKDLKISKYMYFTTEVGEVILFMLNKKDGVSANLTSIELYYYER